MLFDVTLTLLVVFLVLRHEHGMRRRRPLDRMLRRNLERVERRLTADAIAAVDPLLFPDQHVREVAAEFGVTAAGESARPRPRTVCMHIARRSPDHLVMVDGQDITRHVRGIRIEAVAGEAPRAWLETTTAEVLVDEAELQNPEAVEPLLESGGAIEAMARARGIAVPDGRVSTAEAVAGMRAAAVRLGRSDDDGVLPPGKKLFGIGCEGCGTTLEVIHDDETFERVRLAFLTAHMGTGCDYVPCPERPAAAGDNPQGRCVYREGHEGAHLTQGGHGWLPFAEGDPECPAQSGKARCCPEGGCIAEQPAPDGELETVEACGASIRHAGPCILVDGHPDGQKTHEDRNGRRWLDPTVSAVNGRHPDGTAVCGADPCCNNSPKPGADACPSHQVEVPVELEGADAKAAEFREAAQAEYRRGLERIPGARNVDPEPDTVMVPVVKPEGVRALVDRRAGTTGLGDVRPAEGGLDAAVGTLRGPSNGTPPYPPMPDGMVDVREWARQNDRPPSSVRKACTEGRFPGAVKHPAPGRHGWKWIVPADGVPTGDPVAAE